MIKTAKRKEENNRNFPGYFTSHAKRELKIKKNFSQVINFLLSQEFSLLSSFSSLFLSFFEKIHQELISASSSSLFLTSNTSIHFVRKESFRCH